MAPVNPEARGPVVPRYEARLVSANGKLFLQVSETKLIYVEPLKIFLIRDEASKDRVLRKAYSWDLPSPSKSVH